MMPCREGAKDAKGAERNTVANRSLFQLGLFVVFGLLSAPPAGASPDIQHWTLENGARVYFVEARELPMVQLSVVFDAGSARDPAGRRGLAALTSRLLREGAGGLDTDAIATRLEDLGAELATSASQDMASVGLRSLSDRRLLDPAIELVALVLRAPDFPFEALARERARALVRWQQGRQQPGEVANRAYLRQLYGTHPYAVEPQGDEDGLKALTREDVEAFHRRYYRGSNALLALVGDLDRAGAEGLARRLLADLPAGEAAPRLPPVADLAAPAERRLTHPSAQSHILIGQPGISRSDPDYFPLLVGNYTLGGSGLVSRLAAEIREKRGLSYSMYSYFTPLLERGPFTLGLQTRNDQREEALAVARRVLAEFVAEGPSAEELAAAKQNITGGFALRLDSSRKILEQIAYIGYYGLPLDYLDRFIERIEAVTLEEVRAAWKRRVHPQRMVTVIVGGQG